MSILNVMWAGGAPFASIHKVHQQILAQAESSSPIKTWLLQGTASGCEANVGEIREWRLSSARLKGRHFWRLAKPWMQAGFRQALQDSQAHVLLLDGMGVARALLPILKSMPHVRVVVIFHSSTRLSAADKLLFQRFPAAQLKMTAVSNTLAESLSRSLQLPVLALRSAYDPVIYRNEALSREDARARLGLPLDSAPVLGTVGRLVSKKGFTCLLDAFAEAVRRQPGLRLVIIGEGPARSALEAQVDRLGLRGSVSLPGHLNDAARLYRAFDWVAIPSREEGLGLTMQEAVMAGVPVLSSELAVFREQLAGTGWYAPADDVKAWSDLIVRAFSVPAESVAAEQYQALAPDQAWQRFSRTARTLLS
ncbi:glycosyltransferase [Pseudomonas vancouverensis]|uniref:glycosyltransferase n=1 Tax=Pseudomonas vancouverensis TaxID=95300 RepID=UPI003D00FBC4